MSSPQAPLHYSPQPPSWHRRRRTHRILIIFTCILTVILIVGMVPIVTSQFLLRQLLSRCMTHTEPTGTIALELDSARAKQLSSTDSGYQLSPKGNSAWLINSDCNQLASWIGYHSMAVVFCHELTSASGTHRLVIIDADEPVLWVTVLDPSGLSGRPKLLHLDQSFSLISASPVRIFAGQIDSENASHFIIRFQGQDGVMHTINCWLNDNDSVTFERE